MSEYLGDYSISSSKRAINSRKESLWGLVHDLITIFRMKSFISPIVLGVPLTELHEKGLDCLITCYPNRLEQIKKVYLQEVLRVEVKKYTRYKNSWSCQNESKGLKSKKSKKKEII